MSDFTTPRITEKRYLVIPPTVLTADGTIDGLISITNTYCFKVGQVVLFKQGTTHKIAKIQQVISETQFYVIEKGESIITKKKLDMSGFLAGSTVELMEAKRPVIDLLEIQRQVYEEEPTVALRNHLVDWLGRSYDTSNPMPVQLSDGDINIGTVNAEVEVQLSHQDNVPDQGDVADSVQIGDGTNIAKIDTKNKSFSVNRYEKLLPLLTNAKWLELVDYEAVIPTFAGDIAVLDYYKAGNIVAKATFTFATDMDWSFTLESFINDDDGDNLLDDDGEPLLLD